MRFEYGIRRYDIFYDIYIIYMKIWISIVVKIFLGRGWWGEGEGGYWLLFFLLVYRIILRKYDF